MDGNENPSNFSSIIQSKKFKTTHQIDIARSEETLNLPPEIIAEILARVPVKSLLKFRCVSKSWLSLISSSQFILNHLEVSKNNPNLCAHRLMLTICNPQFDLRHCSINSLMFDPSTAAYTIDYPKRNSHSAVWVVGSCNGLVCIALDEDHMFLWNPSTRKSRKLPPVSVQLKLGFYYIWGFGYDESDNDYKVVGVFCVFGNGGLYDSVVKSYSMKTDSWKIIESFKGGVPLDDSGKFANGKLHFPATREFPGRKWNIVSLDLNSEAYGSVEQPDYGEGTFDTCLGVLGGWVCVLCDYAKVRSDIWVLKEYGNKESWCKLVTVPYVDELGKFSYSTPLCMLPSGEILLGLGTELVVYNPRDKYVRYAKTSNIGSFLEADVYVESLVSLQVQCQ